MRAINGKLDMSKSYRLVSVECGELSEYNVGQCENCGQVIANVAIVEDNTGKQYGVGLDCVMTIINMPASDQQQAQNTINRQRRFLKKLRLAKSVAVKNNSFWFYHYVTDKWAADWKGRGDYNLYEKIIKALNIPIIEETAHKP